MSNDQHAPLLGQSDKIVQVENLSKKYGDNIAVNGISFSLTKGEVFAFLGPNGAGKTTTVEILECLRNPTLGPGGDPKTNRRPPTRLQRNRPTHSQRKYQLLRGHVQTPARRRQAN